MEEQVVKQLADALVAAVAEQKTVAATGTTTGIYQPGGPFSICGLDRNVITAHMRPEGISTHLPLMPGNETDPRFATLTGVTDDVGALPNFPCDNAPTGYLKACNLTARYGFLSKSTNTIDWNKVRIKARRGVFDDLQLRGRMLGLTDLVPGELNESQMLDIVTMAEMVQAGVRLERELSTQMWQGSPAVATPGGGYIQFPGLDVQIATGQVDADTNTPCPAVDSDVKDFMYDDVCGTGRSIHEFLSMLEWYIYYNASKMGLLPASWVIAMRPELWFELSQCWPCAYNTNKCGNAIPAAANTTVQLQGTEMTALTQAMRDGNFIDINGRRYTVVTDDGIFEHTNINNANLNAAEYASSIYMVPQTITGSFPATYREHVDYRLGGDDVNLLRGLQDFWTDDGVYSWAIENQKWCYELTVKTEQRVVLRTPQLAGRIDHVKYSPLQHLRDFDPDSPYHQDGGVSVRVAGTTYAVWL